MNPYAAIAIGLLAGLFVYWKDARAVWYWITTGRYIKQARRG